jgi:hypothetical protein
VTAFTLAQRLCATLRPLTLGGALLLASCTSGNTPAGPAGSTSSTGGSSGAGGSTSSTGGSGGTSPSASGGAGTASGGTPGTGGASGSGGSAPSGSGGTQAADTGPSADTPSPPDMPAEGGTVLFIGGGSPMVGTDLQIHNALKERGLTVKDVRETAMPTEAAGMRLIVMSYSMQSDSFKADLWADVPVPIVVLEHNLLPLLGMSQEHGYQFGVTLTITAADAALTAGLPMGDLGVYTPQGKEMFWGVPGPESIKVASMKGSPGHVVYFAYPSGAMMVGRKAPAKRMLFFAASHAPPPVNDQILNADGVKLLGAAVDWLIK